MTIKNGLVMEIKENAACIMTPDGEFVKVKIDKSKTLPVIGGDYEGRVYDTSFKVINKFKYITAACLMFLMLSLGGGAYAYYTPISTVTININPSIEFKLNRWNRVLSSRPLNSDGEKILQEIKTKNVQIDDALVLVVNQSKKDKYINDNYINSGKTITVNITGKKISLPILEKELSKDNLNGKIDNNGTTVFNKINKKTNNTSSENSDSSVKQSKGDENKPTVNGNSSNADKINSNTNKNYNAPNNVSNGNSNNAKNNDNNNKNNNSLENNKKYKDDPEKSNENLNKSTDNKNSNDRKDNENKNDKADAQDKGNKNK